MMLTRVAGAAVVGLSVGRWGVLRCERVDSCLVFMEGGIVG